MTIITWAALGLLLLTYLHFGWTLFEASNYFLISFLIISCIWSIDLFFTVPFNKFKWPVIKWFKSDIGTFFMIVILSIIGVVMFTWMHIFINVLLMISATALARLELQTAKFKNWQAFLILSLLSTVGLVVGWLLKYSLIEAAYRNIKWCFILFKWCINLN